MLANISNIPSVNEEIRYSETKTGVSYTKFEVIKKIGI
jgi:hypothetical protein